MRERRIALYDIDKTSYQGLLIIDLAMYQVRTKTLEQATLDKIANEEELHRTGKSYEDMARDMLIHWAKGLKGKKISYIEDEINKFFKTSDGKKFFPFVQESIDILRPTHDTYFVTAEPQFVAEEVARIHQATGYVSSIFETKDGILTGKISSSLAKREDKKNAVGQIMQTHTKEKSFAFGDSDSDIEMLEGVDYPICVNPNDELTRTAMERGWQIKKPEEIVVYIRNVLAKPRS